MSRNIGAEIFEQDSTVLNRTLAAEQGHHQRGNWLSEIADSRRLASAFILTFGALVFLLNLGGYPLYTKGEPREAVTIFDIVNGSGWILPMRAGVEIPSKPLLMHWMAAVLAMAAGVNEWTVRLPSALCAIAGMLACSYYVRRLFDAESGLIAALILGTTVQYMQAGTGARVDMTLTFFMEIAFFEFIMITEGLRARVWLFYFAMALAVLTKGPIGVALPVLVAMVWTLLYRRWELIPHLKVFRGALIVAVIGGGWYLAAIATGGSAFVHKQLLAENLYRLVPHAAAREGHAHPFYYEECALLAGFLPWTLIAILATIQYRRSKPLIDSRLGYLIVWFVTVLLFYNLPQSKRGVYLLALYPALSAIIALLLRDAIRMPEAIAHWNRAFSRTAGIIFVCGGAGVAIALVELWASPSSIATVMQRFGERTPELAQNLKVQAERWMLIAGTIPAALVASGVWLMMTRSSMEKLLAGVFVATVCAALAVNLVVEPGIAETLTLKRFAAEVRGAAGSSTVGYFGNLDYDFAFYNGRDLTLTTPLDPNGPAMLVSPEDDWKLVPRRLSIKYRTVLRSNPTDLDGSGRMLLLERIS
jgi:4-amino-4-deoxy-L-arabinose transferase-like glycosyltransferase